MGGVYRARDSRRNRAVAVVFPEHSRQRFEREARAISGNIMLTKSEAKLLDFEHRTEVSPEVKLAMEDMVLANRRRLPLRSWSDSPSARDL